jgi:hypothetical protein
MDESDRSIENDWIIINNFFIFIELLILLEFGQHNMA